MKLLPVAIVLCLLPASLFAMPSAHTRHPLPATEGVSVPAGSVPKPLGRDDFVWQERATELQQSEANRRLLEGLGRCSQFALESRAEADKIEHTIFFQVGGNRSPWPIGRIELRPLVKGSQVSLGQNKQFSMGIGKFQKMWGGYLDEKYDCPPKPGAASGGMHHP